jgi:hypothetical protein
MKAKKMGPGHIALIGIEEGDGPDGRHGRRQAMKRHLLRKVLPIPTGLCWAGRVGTAHQRSMLGR